ncbi:hypothetical protein FQA47_017476 [Oryzias melastigma]|uniref:Uncharacterized protein n=1 Tax=Oryzias melastigma TaxID=30732 RepID=A0A834FMX5_ORYME|nr:hypothetical protein FQA47_017476 [Oryzias melastigma]
MEQKKRLKLKKQRWQLGFLENHYVDLCLPSRLRGRCVSGRRGGSGGTARNAPFRASHLTEEPREAEEEEKGEEEEEEKEDSVCSEVMLESFDEESSQPLPSSRS